MGWFDQQLRYRSETDDANFADAIASVADAVTGRQILRGDDARSRACGAIDKILEHYGVKASDEELPDNLRTLGEQLEYRMQPHGIGYRTVDLPSGWYKDAVGALLGRLKADGSYVALLPEKAGGYSFTDPSTGCAVRVNRRTQALLESEAVCFYRPLPLRALGMKDLLGFMKTQLSAADLALYFFALAAAAALGLIAPRVNQWLFGVILPGGNMQALAGLAGFMIAYSCARVCLSAFGTLVTARIRMRQDIAVEAAVMQRVLSLPASFFGDYSAGELSQRTQYVRLLCSSILDSLGTTSLTALFSLIYVVQIFRFAPGLTWPALVIPLLTLLFSTVTALYEMKFERERMKKAAKTSGLSYATISGIRKIKLAGAEKRMFARWARSYAGEARLTYARPLRIRLAPAIQLGITLAGSLIFYAIAARDGVSVADYCAFMSAYGMVTAAFGAMSGIVGVVASIRPILEMVRPILEATPETAGRREIVTALRGGIELNHVCFRYDEGMPNVIDDLSLTIHPGEYLAVVGSTGCGKSTLMRLMLGFIRPDKGGIYYDRRDLNSMDLKSLRRKIGTVMQDGMLFSGDLYENITITSPGLTLDDAWEAAEVACVADDIRAMPMGMQTFICEGTGGISGGQKQRLLIARAVAPKPKILMFDEATSALDNVTQKKISEALDGMKCTRVVIAHRLSTIRHADRIVYLEAGRIAEEGTYEELIAKNGRFADLVRRQRLDIDIDD